MGTMPMIMASAVIITGRKRVKPASTRRQHRIALRGQMFLGEADNQNTVRRGHSHAHDGAHHRGYA